MAKTFSFNDASTGGTYVSTTNVSLTSVRYDDNGVATSDSVTVTSSKINSSRIPRGDSTTDTLYASSSANKVIIWDEGTNNGSPNLFSGERFGFDADSQTRAIELIQLGTGNDLVNLTYRSGSFNSTAALEYSWYVTIDAGGGNDVVWSGAGNDFIYGGSGNDWVDGGQGDDEIHGGDGADRMYGGSGNDVGYGNSGNDSLWGGSGNDVMSGKHGADTVYGDSGDDTVSGEWTTRVTYDVAGADVVYGGDGNDQVYGNEFADVLYGGANNDFLKGDVYFDDSIPPDMGADTIFGDDGLDKAFGDGGNDTIYGGADADTVVGDQEVDNGPTISTGADLLYGGSGADVIYGDDFGDTGGEAGEGSDTIFGGADNDLIYTGAGNDTADGDEGTDSIYGSLGDDTLSGDAGSDTLFGGDDDDALYGGLETNSSGAAIDTYAGDAGDDRLYYDADNTLGGGTNTIELWDGCATGAVAVSLTSGYNWTNDQFFGGTNSTAATADGQDTLVLGGGNDVFVLKLRDLVVNGSAQGAVAGTGVARLASVEVILAGAGADIVMLNSYDASTPERYATAVTLEGHDGDDILLGGLGNDTIVGGRLVDQANELGVDIIAGGKGADVIYGGDLGDVAGGDSDAGDTLFGGCDLDTLYGGGGNDLMYGGTYDDGDAGDLDRFYGGKGDDVVRDYANAGYVDGGDGDDSSEVTWNNAALGGQQFGGAGADCFINYGTYGTITVDMGAGNDYYQGGEWNTAGGVDIVYGGAGTHPDVIDTNGGNDTVYGGDGNDAVWGGAGADTIYGGANQDYLYAGSGNGDKVYGGSGADYYFVSTGDGNDTLFGDGVRDDTLVLHPQFATNGVDYWIANTSARDLPGSIGYKLGSNGSGDINMSINSGVVTLTSNATGSPQTVTFNTADVLTIELYSDGTHQGEIYTWNSGQGWYTFSGYA